MKKMMKNIAAAALAVTALAAPFAGSAATGGDIYEIRPVDETGAAILPPTAPLDGGDVARFVVRLMRPTMPGGNQFRLHHVGIGSEASDLVFNRPAIGIYVNGVFTLAYLEKWYAKNNIMTDFIFTYTVKPGDFAQPIRLANADKEMVTDSLYEPSGSYYFNFCDPGAGVAAWQVDDSTESEAMTRVANFYYGPNRYSITPPDGTQQIDYDLAKCNFRVQTVDFDKKDESASYWRTVHQHATEAQPVGDIPSLVVSGVPTNSVTLYVWSENEDAVMLIKGRDAIVSTRPVHVTATTVEDREVAEIKIVAGKQDYEFNMLGVAKDKDATIVMSAFPDFNYSAGTNVRLTDEYLTRTVRCIEPMPASVTIKPGKSPVTATSEYTTYVTELNVALSENPVAHDFNVEIVPEFTDTSCPNDWWDYFRLSASPAADPTLTTPTANPVLVFKAGETTPSTLDGVALTDGKIYLYAIRSDEHVTGANKITFKVTTTDADAIKPVEDGGIGGWGDATKGSLTINAQNPVVESMFDGTDKAAAIAGVGRTLQIVVSDVYADMQSDAGYEIWIEKNTDVDTEFTKIDGLYKPGKGDVLYKVGTTDTLPTVTYSETGDISSTLYVVSPVSRNQSANHNFTVSVTAPAGYTVTTTDDVYDYMEGDALQLKIVLDKQNTLGDIYAYIKGETDDDTAAIDCTWKAVAGGKGRKLANYATSLSSGCTLVMLDGDASKLGSTFSYEVVFLTQDTWTDDPDKRVTAFQAKNTLVLTTHNVIPTVDTVTMGLYDIGESGATVGGETNPAKFPVGIEQTFTIAVDEPGELDKDPINSGDRKFQVRWKFTDEGGATSGPTYPAGSETTGIVEGNPDDLEYRFDFPSPGKWTVTVDMRDKDMGNKWGNGTEGKTFVFYVYVIDQPAIKVTADASYNEQSCLDFGGEAKIDVDLELNNCTFEMWVNLVVAHNKTGDVSTFALQEGDDVVKQPDGSYNVKFGPRSTHQEIFVQTMDGTAESRTMGFKIVPTMVEDNVHTVPNSGGKRPHEYYVGVPVSRVLVYNDPPLLDEQYDVYPVPGTNAIPASIGAADEAITWSFNDVALDFSRGITVEFKGGGGWGPKSYTDREAALADGAVGFVPTFGASGPQTVKLIVKDPDGATATVIWEYDVAASKSMTLVAHGPASGDVAKYNSAAGLGEGRVWAESKSAIAASSFASIINCGLATSWKVYGYGYKVGDLDDGASFHYPDGLGGYETSYYADRDTPLNGAGNNKGAADEAYAYKAPLDMYGNPVDSFLYAWMLKAASQTGSTSTFSLLNEQTAPESIAVGRDSGRTVDLPSEVDDKGNYAETTLEAIFSIEYLASDNMGDINLDGIPDVYVNKYGMGLVDTEAGTSSGSDLTKLDAYNLDTSVNNTGSKESTGGSIGDYLPSSETSVYGSLIPNLPATWVNEGIPFTAKLEIRGNGPSLNDATENNSYTRIANLRPDIVYTDPRTDSKSTLDGYDGSMPVEYLAWLDFAAANGLDPENKDNWTDESGKAVWSPERPTDPTAIDTDGDGFPDGYEYFIWYRAHVGYNDGGVHRYLTGRRYDPRNPGEGKFISAAEIAAAVDPVMPNSALSNAYDTDNDGLPDLIEYEIGTNPIDFDTDGDGLPDGFEVMISGTDPLLAYSTTGISDAMRNFDGDAMAYSAPWFEKKQVLPAPKHVKSLSKFALVDADGDTDGIQWYVMPTSDVPADSLVYTDDSEGYLLAVGGVTYVTTARPAVVVRGGKVRLAVNLSPEMTWTAGTVDLGEGDKLVRLMPTRLVAGTELDEEPDTSAKTAFGFVSFESDVADSMTAWPYGRAVDTTTTGTGLANLGGFGFLAIGRYKDAPAGIALAALPEEDDTIAYLHHQVYQEFGFDPRTAWNANTPLSARWGKTADSVDENGEASSEAKDNNLNSDFPYVGIATRTREYTLYDEFLVMSFFLNGLEDGSKMAVSPTTARPWLTIWSMYTTNGRGPGEDKLLAKTDSEQNYSREAINESPDELGADTDADGVPDGWELYVMSGPKRFDQNKKKYYFRMPSPYSDDYMSAFGPFMPEARNASYTDNSATGGYETTGGDGDGLTERQEFSGTDTTLYYASIYSDENHTSYESLVDPIVKRAVGHENWLNKFFPTDPWNSDTDNDGRTDSQEKDDFAYNYNKVDSSNGAPYDDGKLVTIPGGGLNPLTVDTDFDGLPDGWEVQFKGNAFSVYGAPESRYVIVQGSNAVKPTRLKKGEIEMGNPLEGLTDGMDGTVPDAYNISNGSIEDDGSFSTHTLSHSDGSKMFAKVNRDYDFDGLENWQEYMAGTMRCWRYDDILSPWDVIPDEAYWDANGNFAPNYEMLGIESTGGEDGGDGEFWYKTLVDKKSGIYNPRLLSNRASGGMYFSRVKNMWDLVYVPDELGAAWYYFKDRIDDNSLEDLWAKPFAEAARKNGAFRTKPGKYISCSPLEYDTDHDGMDDYYELFHGMNPLLGASGVKINTPEPCDIVFDAWMGDYTDTLVEAWRPGDPTANYWTLQVSKGNYYKNPEAGPRGTGYDFEYYPWLNGMATADPDGDDVRNQTEAIMPRLAAKTWLHTDPTPLWMTDTSYARSLTRMFYRMPGRDSYVPTGGDSFTYNGATYDFCDFGGWAPANEVLPARFVASQQDLWWYLYEAGEGNWMFSFEENEGYDSDHDAMSDATEAEGRLRAASDPQDANSPNHRQAMYFQGSDRPSALQTPPEVEERYAVTLNVWPDETTFMHFTVEAWAKAESLEDSVVVERAIWCDASKAGDEDLVRKNFQLGIKDGKWCARYDANGTLVKSSVEVLSAADASTDGWHHLAATYDGARFILYVDGEEAATPVESVRQPEYGTSALVLHRKWGSLFGLRFGPGDYLYDTEYALRTIVVGASLRTQTEGGSSDAFDVHNGAGWNFYNRFFKGYVDEIRIWDGARSAADVRADCRALRRYSRETALENRSSFYKDWSTKGDRYSRDYNGDAISVVPELRYHFSFDSVPGGADEAVVAKTPAGFDYYQPEALGNPERGAAVLSRPEDWNVAWWKKIVEGDDEAAGYGSVYSSDQWVQWVPNTVAHLPRFDGTTLDSFFWSENTCGGTNGTYYFARTAEPASRWTQLSYNATVRDWFYAAPGARHHLVCELDGITTGDSAATNSLSRFAQFRFSGRNALTDGLDLLPLGGAYAKSCPSMWDAQGASTSWEITSDDANFNDLPDMWEEFAVVVYSPESEPLDWDTFVYWKADLDSDEPGLRMTAGEAYRRDLAHGRVVAQNEDGRLDVVDRVDLAQTADEDFSRTPDWWDDLYGVYGVGGTTDSDNDGLNNYVEYLVSEMFPFGMALNPKMPQSDAKTLDYFRKVGSLYLGEMFTDHDQMEDHWERSLDSDSVDPNVWDAQRDGDEDGWSNFAENRYNGWCQSTLAQLISHTVGDTSLLDMPKPAIKLTARYNGKRDLTSAGGDEGETKDAALALHVLTYTDPAMAKADAEFVVQPGEEVSGEFYMGGWENRVIRGTLQPGYISYGDVDLVYTQLPQDNMYSWVDANGDHHISRPYSEFKEALEKDPDIIQNVSGFKWSHLVAPTAYGATSDKAVTVTSGGYIAIYGERVGKIDLQTGDFEFDMAAMTGLRFDGFYEGAEENAWGLKEAIYKLTYTAKVPNAELYKVTASLATPARGFVKGGRNSFFAYWDVDNDNAYTPGTDPCGVVRDVEIGWRGRPVEIEMSETMAITPRVMLWESANSDRVARFSESPATNRIVAAEPEALPPNVRVRVVRYVVDNQPVWTVSTDAEVIFDKPFEKDVRGFIHEGDFIVDGEFDIDWDKLEANVCKKRDVIRAGLDVTNMTYAIVIGDGDIEYYSEDDDYHTVYAHPYMITRRFEKTHTPPTAVLENGDSLCRVAQPTFRWKIEDEDPWASAFGTTYTAFRVVVKNSASNEVYNSGYQRMPVADSAGVYSWTAPLYVDSPSPSGDHLVFHNLSNYTWQVFTYNAKFKTDNVGSEPQTFRMNVTDQDLGAFGIDVNVVYAGPATNLANHVRVQAFESPDFTGAPVAEAVVADVSAAALAGQYGSAVRLPGLKAGKYFLRAYIDTDTDWVLDGWESWGYLSERDHAAVSGSKEIFTPAYVTVGSETMEEKARMLYIEDRDTDGDGFPDVWEAEQNGNVFAANTIAPVTGDAELIAVNPALASTLTKRSQGVVDTLLAMLNSANGVSLMTGIPVSQMQTLGGSLVLPSTIVEDSVAITSLAIDRESRNVVLGVGAKTSLDAVDPAVAAIYSVNLGATVTVKVYRTETLAADWSLVAEKVVTITSAGTEMRAPLPEDVDTSSGFFKVEIE